MKINEDGAIAGGPTNSAGGGAIAGIGVPSKDPNAPKNFAEPGVRKKKNSLLKKDPMTRGLMKFKEWIEEQSKHDVRGVTGEVVKIKKSPVRHPGGKMTMEYPGKSSSSGGGD